MTEHIPPTYDDYTPLVRKFNEKYHAMRDLNLTTTMFTEPFTLDEVRLMYLALMASKAHLKAYDPKKGLNQ
jgi:hypothetical protein